MCVTGKRDLPAQLRQRFTELYVPEMTNRGDLQQLVLSYLRDSTQDPPVDAIIDFYLASRTEAVSFTHSGSPDGVNLLQLAKRFAKEAK